MSVELSEQQGVRLAVAGCGHGTLNAIYASVDYARQQKLWENVDMLIIGGDFQSVRNLYDLNCVNMPMKYRHMGDFHEYYSGHRVAPVLTIFVGGNHEASNYLFELYFGGWVAPNIYYLGAANILRFGPLRIMGMNGISKSYDYRSPHHERLPYSEKDLKSIYHVRELDVRKLLQVRTQVDIGLSHDWPMGAAYEGNHKQLFKFKPFLEEDAKNGRLGSLPAAVVLNNLRPRYWFSAHLHCEYLANIHHDEINTMNHADWKPEWNKDEIDLDLDDDYTEAGLSEDTRAALPEAFRRIPDPPKATAEVAPKDIPNKITHFLALDKFGEKRRFLRLSEVLANNGVVPERPYKLMYDREWLAITRTYSLDEPITVGNPKAEVPRVRPLEEKAVLIDKRMLWLDQNFSEADYVVPENFEITAPVYDNGNMLDEQYSHVKEYPNPQTARFCKLLQIPNPLEISDLEIASRMAKGPTWTPPLRERRTEFDSKHRGNQARGGFKANRGGRGGHRGGNRGRGEQRGGRGGHGNRGGYGGFNNG